MEGATDHGSFKAINIAVFLTPIMREWFNSATTNTFTIKPRM